MIVSPSGLSEAESAGTSVDGEVAGDDRAGLDRLVEGQRERGRRGSRDDLAGRRVARNDGRAQVIKRQERATRSSACAEPSRFQVVSRPGRKAVIAARDIAEIPELGV